MCVVDNVEFICVYAVGNELGIAYIDQTFTLYINYGGHWRSLIFFNIFSCESLFQGMHIVITHQLSK